MAFSETPDPTGLESPKLPPCMRAIRASMIALANLSLKLSRQILNGAGGPLTRW
jgi:hypothetical protein